LEIGSALPPDGALTPCRNDRADATLQATKGAHVSARVAPGKHDPVEATGDVAVEIEVSGRWDALALSELLIPFHSFLVQRSPERWVVHARSPGCQGEPLDDALAAIEEWQAALGMEAAVRVDGRPHRSGR
jgi:hypothetical protein